jgi:hypothetical protein
MRKAADTHPYDRGYWYCDRLFKAGKPPQQIRARLRQLRGTQFREGFQDRLAEFLDPSFDPPVDEQL